MVFHDDRTLTLQDADRVLQAFPAGRIVWRAQADERMAEALKTYPRCRQFREENVFGLKLLDTLLLEAQDSTRYCDGDILFLRESLGMFELPDAMDAVFMMDPIEPVAWTFRELWQRKLQFVARVNAGMYMVRKKVLDLDKLEWFLGYELAPHLRHVQEQTAWAWLAAGFQTCHWDPESVRVVSPRFPVMPHLAAAHFIGIYRSQLPHGLQMLERDTGLGVMKIQFRNAARFDW